MRSTDSGGVQNSSFVPGSWMLGFLLKTQYSVRRLVAMCEPARRPMRQRLLLRNGSHRPSITDYRTTPTEPPRFERSIASPRHNGDLCPLRRSRIGKFSAPLPGAIHSVHDRVFMQTTQVAALKTTSSIRGQGVSDAAFSSLFDENAKLREQRVALRQKQLHDLEN